MGYALSDIFSLLNSHIKLPTEEMEKIHVWETDWYLQRFLTNKEELHFVRSRGINANNELLLASTTQFQFRN